MSDVKILAFAGSARKESFNKKLVKIVAQGASKAGAAVTVVDLKDYPMPLMNQDLEAEEGMPENARKLKELFLSHDGFLISTPEYNSSITPLLKNTIDWISRKSTPTEGPLIAYKDKVAGLVSASPGYYGGSRSLTMVRSLLEYMGAMVITDQKSISKAHEAFAEDGSLKDKKDQEAVEKIGEKLVSTIKKLKA